MKTKNLGRYALEATTIIASILFALWVDATWDDYQERQREQKYLAGLAVEFDGAAREIAGDQRIRRVILGNLQAALAPDENTPLEQARLAASDPSNILNARFYTPSHPTLEDLTASGNLQILESETLRLALLNYTQERQRLQVVEQDYRDFINDNTEPFILANADLGRHPLGIGPRTSRPLSLALWDDPRFVNLVWWNDLSVAHGPRGKDSKAWQKPPPF